MTRATSKQGQVYHLMRGKIILCWLMLALILLSHLSSQIFCLALNDRLALVQTLLLSSLLFWRTIFSSLIFCSFLPLCVLTYCYQLVLFCLCLLYSKCLFTVRYCQRQLSMFFTQPLSLFRNNHCFAYFHSFLLLIYLD